MHPLKRVRDSVTQNSFAHDHKIQSLMGPKVHGPLTPPNLLIRAGCATDFPALRLFQI